MTISELQSHRFYRTYTMDLAQHQHDDQSTASGVFDSAREVVAWYAANEPNDNVIPADEVDAFLAWMDARRDELIAMTDLGMAQ